HFEETSLAPPIGSGPYIVKHVDAGRSATLARNPDYWGAQLPINRGLWNFDEVRSEFYRDDNSYFEGFKKGLYHIRAETDPTRRQLFRGLRIVRARAARRCPRARDPEGFPRCRAQGYAGRHLSSDRQRRFGTRPRGPEEGARDVCRGRIRARRHRAAQARHPA